MSHCFYELGEFKTLIACAVAVTFLGALYVWRLVAFARSGSGTATTLMLGLSTCLVSFIGIFSDLALQNALYSSRCSDSNAWSSAWDMQTYLTVVPLVGLFGAASSLTLLLWPQRQH